MIPLNYGLMENLSLIDDPVSVEERSHVDRLIRQELQHNNTDTADSPSPAHQQPLHPLVDQILPLPSHRIPSPLLNHEIERYEEEDIEEEDPKIIEGGIDVERYTNFTTPGGETDYSRIYTTLSYSDLEERNLALLINNHHDISSLQEHHLVALQQLRNEQATELVRKRESADQVNVVRKKRQVSEFKPMNDYLNDKWKDGIKSVVELGIEAGRLDMDISSST